LQGLALFAGAFSQDRQGAFTDANAGAWHEFYTFFVAQDYKFVYRFVSEELGLDAR
jgi:hypothetical protein